MITPHWFTFHLPPQAWAPPCSLSTRTRTPPSPGATFSQRQAWPRPTEPGPLPTSLLPPQERTSIILQAGSQCTGRRCRERGSLSPLGDPRPPQAYLSPHPSAPPPLSGGAPGWSQLSDLWEGVPGPLLLLSGLPLGFSVPVTSSFSPILLALFSVIRGGGVWGSGLRFWAWGSIDNQKDLAFHPSFFHSYFYFCCFHDMFFIATNCLGSTRMWDPDLPTNSGVNGDGRPLGQTSPPATPD